MLILDSVNNYGFANATIKVVDQTYVENATAVEEETVPAFNILIPTVQPEGLTNTVRLYQPGDLDGFLANVGTPNALLYGYGPDMIAAILARGASGVGVYHVNLRGADASMANVALIMKYKVEEDVNYTDEDGNQYYVDENGELTTDPTDKPVIRNVLHVKFENAKIEGVNSWKNMYKKMNSLANDTPDDDGYKSIPYFGIMYRGASEFGNNVYFNMIPSRSDMDNQIYYAINLFDGYNMINTDSNFSLDVQSGARYGDNNYIETVFNGRFNNVRFVGSMMKEDVVAIIEKYLYTVQDWIDGNTASPSLKIGDIDPFTCTDLFGITVDEGSLDSTLTNAFTLSAGSNGAEYDTPDALYKKFFDGEIITDIKSPLSYHYNYIPDIGYDIDTKQSIVNLLTARNRMTVATFMVGDDTGFYSAMNERLTHWYKDNPSLRLIAKVQSPMRYDAYTRKTLDYPASYYDTVALIDHFVSQGNYYAPFAGADCRWTDFISDTMEYPAETVTQIKSLYSNRINVCMKDNRTGCYLSDQQMNTEKVSDQTEFNNALLVTNMLFTLVGIVHQNHFHFNEPEHLREFNVAVEELINGYYSQYSASMSVTVTRLGTTGRAKSANRITVRINMLDIAKYADVELYLVDD